MCPVPPGPAGDSPGLGGAAASGTERAESSRSQGLFLPNIQELLWQQTWAMSPSSPRGCKSRKEVFEITIHSCLYCYFIP